MGAYLLRRCLIACVLVIGAASLVFVLLQAVPGDPARVFLGDNATEDQVVAVRHQMGLDRPLTTQYLDWLGGLARGNFGDSLSLSRPVRSLLLERLPRTLEVVLVSTLLALIVGLPIGIISALHRGQAADVGLTSATLVSLSVPTYVTGTILVLLFAVRLKWLPASGFVGFQENPVKHLQYLALPCITLASHLAATIARMTRSSILETANQDYVRTARAKGLRDGLVIRRHILRTGLIPITTVVGLQAGNLLGGAVIVESIFAWPGLSTLLFRGIETRDFPVVQGCVLLISALFILFTLIVDLVNGLIDPRVAQVSRT